MRQKRQTIKNFQLCVGVLFIMFFVCGLFSNIVLAVTTSILRPTADGGDDSAIWKNTAKIKCDAADCYLDVDETSGSYCANSDGDISYISSSVSGASQTFDINESSIPDNSIITQIDITVCYKKPKGSGDAIQTRYCHNGSCSDSGANLPLVSEYTESTQSHAVNFTKTSNSDIEIGVTNQTAQSARLSQISAVITYTPPAPAPNCGDGNLDPGEECDDGNNNNGDGCSAICQTETEKPSGPEPPSILPSPGGSRTLKVILSGQAYPKAKIEIFRRSIGDMESSSRIIPLETHQAAEDGSFDLSLGLLLPEEMFFALRAEDKDGRKTDIIAFDADLETENTLEAKNILLPPTVGLEKTVVSRGKKLNVLGYASPNSLVEITVDSLTTKQTKSNHQGLWTFEIATLALHPGEHRFKARQINQSGKESLFSSPKSFKLSLLKFPEVDFNGDEKINITDWSIFLFRWGNDDEKLKPSIDLNNDGEINIYDFSVFLNAMTI